MLVEPPTVGEAAAAAVLAPPVLETCVTAC